MNVLTREQCAQGRRIAIDLFQERGVYQPLVFPENLPPELLDQYISGFLTGMAAGQRDGFADETSTYPIDVDAGFGDQLEAYALARDASFVRALCALPPCLIIDPFFRAFYDGYCRGFEEGSCRRRQLRIDGAGGDSGLLGVLVPTRFWVLAVLWFAFGWAAMDVVFRILNSGGPR